eukprot:PhF_6_TR43097/c0_g1_i1/m.65830
MNRFSRRLLSLHHGPLVNPPPPIVTFASHKTTKPQQQSGQQTLMRSLRRNPTSAHHQEEEENRMSNVFFGTGKQVSGPSAHLPTSDVAASQFLTQVLHQTTTFDDFRCAVSLEGNVIESLGPRAFGVLMEGCIRYNQYRYALLWASKAAGGSSLSDEHNRISVLQCLASSGQGSAASRYFLDWYGEDNTWREDCCAEVIRAYSISGDTNTSFEWLLSLRNRNTQLHTITPYSAALLACTAKRDATHATKILFTYYSDGHKEHSALLADYFAAVVRCGGDDAIAMYDALRKEQVEALRSEEVYLVLLGACAKSNDTKNAIRIFGNMIQDDITPSQRTTQLLMVAHRCRDQSVVEIYDSAIRRHCVKPSQSMCTMALVAAANL